MERLTEALATFGLENFRHGQREVIEAVLSGRHTVAVMPTGAGKSLCYQLPATLLEGVALVVSPLISLMKDQVDTLNRRGIPAAELSSALDDGERVRRLAELSRGQIKLLYVAPERFRSARFWDTLRGLQLSLVAVDEAHCVSQWGHDFRPDYLRLGECLQQLEVPRLVALTATATPEVRRDIQDLLGMKDPEIFVRGFDRPNLTFRVEKSALADKGARAAELLSERQGGVGIVYVGTRKNAESLAVDLMERKVKVGCYHAGLSDDARKRIQDRFMSGELDALVATNAFGMGVDKADVRVVIHADVPRSLEAYYQEAGRAGRDGKAATCHLLFNHQDVRIQEYLIEGNSPSAEVLRATWKVIKDEPSLAKDEKALAERTGAESGMQAQAALRILMGAGLLQNDPGYGLRAMKPTASAAPFDPATPSRRGEVERAKLKHMASYAYTRGCRRRAILEYFGDPAARALLGGCGSCDNCLDNKRPLTQEEQSRAVAVLRVIAATKGRYGRQKIVAILTGGEVGSHYQLEELPEYGLLKKLKKEGAMALVEELTGAGLIEVARGEYPSLDLTRLGKQVLREPKKLEGLSVRT